MSIGACRRPKNLGSNITEAHRVTGAYHLEWDTILPRRIRKLHESQINDRRSRDYCSAHFEVSDYVIQPIYVVRVGVGRQDVIDVIQPARPKIFRDYPFADAARITLEVILGLNVNRLHPINARSATPVNKQRGSIGHSQKRGVALSDIKKIHMKFGIGT